MLILQQTPIQQWVVNALGVNTTGSSNTAVGDLSLDANTTGSNNTAVGRSTLGANTTGACNTTMGQGSLNSNTTGATNTAFGYLALSTNTTGTGNTAVGQASLRLNTTASYNTAVGQDSLLNATVGHSNTAIGKDALDLTTTGDCNVGVGRNSGGITTTGDNNHSFGYNAQPSSATVSHEITLGNGSNNNLRCADTSISSLSDLRDKKNIEDIPHGLDYILALRPVKFDWNTRDGSRIGKKDYGFIAQELDKVETDFDSAEYTRLVSKENPEKWEADPMKTYPILINAIKELNTKIAELEAKINE